MILESVKNFLLRNKWIFASLIIFIAISFFYHNKIFSIHFVDEEDNFILGHFLLQGQKLYSDLFSHHQPLAYVISAGFQKVVEPENIYMLIKRHRELMIAWSFLWCAILVFKFREKVILPLVVFEISKFYLLGNLFLSESLAVYPILYLTLYLIRGNKERIYKYELFLIGFLISLSALLLAPIWPFLATYSVLLIWFKKINLKQISFIIIGGLIPVIIALPFMDLYYYFHNVFYINYKYYIPQSGEEKFPFSLIKSFYSPVLVLINNPTLESSSFVLRITGILFIISIAFLIKRKFYKILMISLILLTLSNIRYFAPGLQYYSGFHLLVWYALFILISYFFASDLVISLKIEKWRILAVLALIATTLLIVYSSREIFAKRDIEHDYYVNYSQQYAFGEAIKAMRSPQDTLFVVPDEWLLYFGGDVKNNNKMVNFYGWMSLVWELNDPVVEKFKTSPPTFFYCDCNEEIVLGYSDKYRQMIRDGAKTPLWVLNDKFINLEEVQKSTLRFFHFQLE